MKVTSKTPKPDFKPITIEVTIESEEELGALYSLFNITDTTQVLSKYGVRAEAFRDALSTSYGTGMPYAVYGPAHEDLVALLNKNRRYTI